MTDKLPPDSELESLDSEIDNLIDLKKAKGKGKSKSKAKPSKAKKPIGRKRSLKKELGDFFGAIGMMVYTRDQYCGERIIAGAEKLAEELNDLAQRNDAVYRILEQLVTGSAYAGVGMAFAAIAVPILAHHGLVPRETAMLFGAPVPPDRKARGVTDPVTPKEGEVPLPETMVAGNGQHDPNVTYPSS